MAGKSLRLRAPGRSPFAAKGDKRWPVWRYLVPLWLSVAVSGCGGCEQQSGIQVLEPFPHTRCLALETPPDKTWEVGGLTLTLRDRELEIAGAPDPVRIAAFSGPAFMAPATADHVAALSEREPSFAVMLGGLGDDDAIASETLATLAHASFVTLFVPGGRDDHRRVGALLSQQQGVIRERLVDLSGIRRVRMGSHEFIPVGGAADGRYAQSGDHCGFSLGDLQALAKALPPPGASRRFLLAWQAPGRGGPYAVARTSAGLDLGSDSLAEFSERVGARGGLFAWPALRLAEATTAKGGRPLRANVPAGDLRLIVPRLTGPALVTHAGARVSPGFAMLALDGRGLRLLGRVEVPPASAALSAPAASEPATGGI